MARATTVKKDAEVVTPQESTVEQATVTDEKKEEVKMTEPRIIQDTDKIEIMNNTTGLYGYISRNGYSFDLEEYGDVVRIPMSELRIMFTSQKAHLKKAWIIILDEDVVEEFNLTRDYQYIFTEEEVNNLLQHPDKIRDLFPKMATAMQTIIMSTAKRKVKAGQLYDLRVVQALKDVSGIDITQ